MVQTDDGLFLAKHDPKLDPWQFRLERRASPHSIPIGAYFLSIGPDIELVKLEDADGRPAGMVFGFAIDLPRRQALKTGVHRLDITRGSDFEAFAEGVLGRLGGRFVWFAIFDDVTRIYLDCAGLVPCVFDPDLAVAATTAAAVLDDTEYEARFDTYLYDRLRVGRDGFFPAGKTAHKGLHRLLPNHYLDLATWKPVRHWPKAGLQPVADPREAIAEIIEIVRGQIEALLNAGPRVAQALTAGHETRMLLGISRQFRNDIDFVTVVGSDRHSIDSIMAKRIADGEGLNHIALPRRTATDEQRKTFIRRGGNCVVDSNSYYAPSVAPLVGTHNFVGGLGGELARGFFWHADDTPDLPITPARLLGRFGQPNEEMLHAPLAEWIESVPDDNALHILDLAYVEHRMGPWSGGQFCNDPTLVRYAPLFTRRSSDLMLGLPPSWKREERMSSEAVSQTWPELNRYPYNNAGMWRAISVKAHRVINDPWVILRRLRKMRK